MKKKVATFQVVLGICAAIGWWGIFYPELTMTPDTYQVIDQDGTVQKPEDGVQYLFGKDIYTDILEADKSRIHFRSKLLTTVEGALKKREP
jgi:hypothetical protein